jgi:hypothetical protein
MSRRIAALAVSFAVASSAPALELIGSFDTPGTASDVEQANGLVYLADGTAGVRIFDVSVPTAPVQLGVLDTPGNGAHLAVEGTRIYVADGFGGMRILDATNPSAPISLGALDLPGGFVDDVLPRGNVAYVVDRFLGFLVADVSNPAAPAVIGSLPALANMRNAFRRGDVVYVNGTFGLGKRVDVANPAAPAVIGDWSEYGLLEADGAVYWNNGNVHVSGPTYTAISYNGVTDYDAFDHFVVLANAAGDVEIWDFSGPFEPDAAQLSSVAFSEWIQDVDVVSGRAYIAVGGESINAGALEIYDVVDPAHPFPLGSVYAGSSVHDVKAVTKNGQTLAYAAQRFGGLTIANVTNPAAPILLGTYDPSGFGEGIDVVGDVAYLAAGSDGLLLIDVANPAAPALLGSFDTIGDARMVTVRNGVAWIADGTSRRAYAVDVSNPASPASIGHIVLPDHVQDLASSGDLLYVAATSGGLRIFNVANPAAPIPLGAVTSHAAWSLALAGRTIWLNAQTTNGLVKVDVTDPMQPTPVARIPGGGYGRFTAAGRLLYGFFTATFQISDGNTAVSMHHGAALLDALPGLTPAAIAADGAERLAYVADGAGGLRVVDLAGDLAALPCRNGDDDDGDGTVDAADAGCRAWDDPTERPDCDDGIDQDGDALVDYPADPGCRNALPSALEDPQCQDGVDNEGDGAIDHPADSLCRSISDDDELANPTGGGCGLGVELLVLGLAIPRRRRA